MRKRRTPKEPKIYDNPDAWIFRAALGWIIAVVVSALGVSALIVWGLVELILLLGRLG